MKGIILCIIPVAFILVREVSLKVQHSCSIINQVKIILNIYRIVLNVFKDIHVDASNPYFV